MSNILITGSEGSLAQWIINKLGSQYNVVGIDNCLRYGDSNRKRSYIFKKGDLNDINFVDGIFKTYKPKFVLHCAAQIYGVVGFHKYSADILGGNATSTQSILSAAVKHQVQKVAYISSSMVYERATKFPLLEDVVDDLPTPTTGYGLSKLFGEKLVKEYNKQYGLDYVIWRPFNIVTPLESSENEPGIAHVMADFIQKIIIDKHPVLDIYGNGEQVRCFSWIDDIADTIVNHSWDNKTNGQTYNLGSEQPTKILDLAKMIWQKSNRTEEFRYNLIDSYHDDVLRRIPDCSKARTTLGFTHTKSIEELIDTCLISHI